MNRISKGKTIRGIGKIFLFIAVFSLVFLLFQRLLTAKEASDLGQDRNLAGIWEEYESLSEGDLDVLFVGSSHVFCGIDPMYIYENSGITSFDLSYASSHFETDYLMAYEGLQAQKPAVLFLDMSAIHYDKPLKTEKLRPLLDQFPLSYGKLEFVRQQDRDDIDMLSVIFPFLYYHSRWDELTLNDFRYMAGIHDKTCAMGHFITYKTKDTRFQFYEEGGDIGTTGEYGWPDLLRIRDLCKEQNVELVLFKIPAPRWRLAQSEAATKIAEALGVSFLDFTYEAAEIGLDPSTDFRDKGNHMNQYGAEKFSAYLMEYLKDTYHFEDKRGTLPDWDENVSDYAEFLNEQRAEEGI